MVNVNSIPWNLPSSLNAVSDLSTLLNLVGRSSICCGTLNSEYDCLPDKMSNQETSAIARNVTREYPIKPMEKKTTFFSNVCQGLVSFDNRNSMCEECLKVDCTLRVRLNRMPQISPDENGAFKNWRYKDSSEQTEYLKQQVKRRINAEKREKYSKERAKIERNSRKIAEKDHRDLKRMMSDIEENRPDIEEDLFPDQPEMNLFWQTQKEMVKKGRREWHPRYSLILKFYHLRQ